MIADVVIVVAMRYVEKGIVAENKLRKLEEQHSQQTQKMDKGEKLARKQHTRQQQHHMAHSSKGGGGGKNTKLNNIQQPSKRD